MTDVEAIEGARQRFLGRGYRGYNNYADPNDCLKPLFDLKLPTNATYDKKSTIRMVASTDRGQYFRSMSADIDLKGKYNGFSGGITAAFKNALDTSTSCELITILDIREFGKVSLSTEPLTTAASQALEDMPAQELFEQYGTHYIKSILVGGRIEYYRTIDQSTKTAATTASGTVKADYATMVGINIGGASSDKTVAEDMLTHVLVQAIGGDPSAVGALGSVSDPKLFSESCSNWAKSIMPNNASIADFDLDGLAPLYELAPPKRRKALTDAWNAYMESKTSSGLLSAVRGLATGVGVRFGDEVYLKFTDNRWVSPYQQLPRGQTVIHAPSPLGDTTEYYPTLGTSGRVALRIDGPGRKPGEPVLTNQFITLTSSESGIGSDNLLGVWSGDLWAYYYTPDGVQQQWVIERADGEQYAPVSYGESVFLTSAAFPGQRLCAAGNLLTSAVPADQPQARWTLVSTKPA